MAARQTDPLAALAAELESRREPRPFYLFHGENRHFRQIAIARLREAIAPAAPGAEDVFGVERRTLDAHSDWAEIDAVLRSYSFFGDRKLVILDVPGKLAEKTREALAAFLEESPGRNVLCLDAPSLDQLRAAKTRVEKAGGLALEFPALKERALADWTARRLRDARIACEPGVPGLLAELLPGDPGGIEQEIEKLRLLVADGRRIDAATVRRLAGGEGSESIWELTALIGQGTPADVLRRLDRLLDIEGVDPIQMVPAMAYAVGMLLRARLFLDENARAGRGRASSAGWREQRYLEQAAALTRNQLLVWLFNLQKLDLRLKRSPAERARPLLEAAILESVEGRHLAAGAP